MTAFRADVVALALSGDGHFLAAGDLAGRVLLWDLGRKVFVLGDLTPNGNRIRPVVFAPTGPSLLVGAFDKPDQPWRLYGGEPFDQRLVFGEAHAVAIDAAVDQAGKRAVSSAEGPDEVAVRAIPEGTVVWRAPEHAEVVAIAPAGDVVAFADKGKAKVVAVADGHEVLAVEESEGITRLALSPTTLVAAVGTKVVSWALPPSALPRTQVALRDDSRPIRELRFIGEKLVAVTRATEEGLVVWNAQDGTPLAEVRLGCACEVHALSADGCIAACACDRREEVRWSRVSLGAGFPGCDAAPAPATAGGK